MLYASEFSISIKNGINPALFKTLVSEVAQAKQNVPWKRCYVDGYFKIKDLVKHYPVSHLFVEYKMQNKFVYLDLANDYLKYKAVTLVNDSNTIFAYVIFKKQELYPSILSASAPHYELIGKTISPHGVTGTKNVYIYLPFLQGEEKPVKDVEELEAAVKSIRNVVKYSDIIEDLKENFLGKIPSDRLVFVRTMKMFNTKVAKSKVLKQHYPFIKKVWDASNEKGVFDNLDYIFCDCEKPLTPETIIEAGSQYRKNLGNIFTEGAKKDAIQNGLRVATNVSLFIVVILDFFNHRFDIGVESPQYGGIYLGRGNNRTYVSLDETANQFVYQLDNNYGNNKEGQRRLCKLAYSLMYYLTNLFETIYSVDENNVVVGYNDSYEYFLVLEKLQEALSDATKRLGFKGENIDVEDIVDNDQSKSSRTLLEFVNWIINRF